MLTKTIGVSKTAATPSEALTKISEAEDLGISAVWLTSGGGGGEVMAVLSAAAIHTKSILLGTSIVQTWSRHPVTLAEETQVIADIAPGRFRLGIGPSHKNPMENTFGADFRAPLGHLTEYIDIIKPLLQTGHIDYEGRWYFAHSSIDVPLDIPVMTSALRPRAFELAGSKADGAISWVCPHFYLETTALSALRKGATDAARSTPPMVVHAPVCVTEDIEIARKAVKNELGYFPTSPFYSNMFSKAGFTGSKRSGWTNEMLDSVLISGNEEDVAARIDSIFDWGGSELVASVVPSSDDDHGSYLRALQLLGNIAAS